MHIPKSGVHIGSHDGGGSPNPTEMKDAGSYKKIGISII
jgi:hypothetical protein